MLKHLIAIGFISACSSTSTPSAPSEPSEPAPQLVVAEAHEPTTAPPLDPAMLELAARRASAVAWLHDYAEAATYPSSKWGQPTSVFVDAKGVRCPMAELVFRSGRADLVAAVRREDNQVRLSDVDSGPLHDWMLGSGLTRAEIDMIQGALQFDLGAGSGSIVAMMAQVRGRLETAEVALRDNTAASLASAASALPAGASPEALGETPILASVLAPAAVAAGAAARATTPMPITFAVPEFALGSLR